MTDICVVILSSNFPSSLSMIMIVSTSVITLKQLDDFFFFVREFFKQIITVLQEMHNRAQRFSTCLLLPAPVSSIETRSDTLHFSIVNGSLLINFFYCAVYL